MRMPIAVWAAVLLTCNAMAQSLDQYNERGEYTGRIQSKFGDGQIHWQDQRQNKQAAEKAEKLRAKIQDSERAFLARKYATNMREAPVAGQAMASRPLEAPAPSSKLFDNRVESFTNSAGRKFESVRLIEISVDGLVWAKQNSTNTARIPLTSLPRSEYSRLKLPEVYLEELMEREDDNVMKAAFERQAAEAAARRVAQPASAPETPAQAKKAARAKQAR